MHRILIVAPNWVGDAVLTQPLLARLKQHDPHAVIDVLAPAWTLPAFARMPEVAGTLANPFGHGVLKLGARQRLARELKKSAYTQAIVLPNSLKSALIPLLAGIPQRTGYIGEARWGLLNDARRLDEKALPLMAERFAALAEPRGTPLPRPLPAPRLTADPAARARTLAALGLDTARPAAVFAPGAEFGPAKRWPPAHFAALARALAATHAIWLIGSAKDKPEADAIERAAPGLCVNLCGRTDLAQAIDVIAAASLAVTNDSGLMHIAAAFDVPLVAVFGSSSPRFTPPLSDKARVVRLDLPCSPCFERVCPLGHMDCLNKLAPERVLAAIAALPGR
jgi:heptosyltransferase-2